MKWKIFILILLFNPIIIQAQDSTTNTNKSGLLEIQFIVPGIAIEQPVIGNFSLKYEFSIGFQGSFQSSSEGNTTSEFYVIPYLKFEPRFYFPSKKLNNSKNLIVNGTYISANLAAIIPTNSVNYWFQYGPIFGWQRSIGRKFFIDFGFGLGENSTFNDTKIVPLANFRIGMIIN